MEYEIIAMCARVLTPRRETHLEHFVRFDGASLLIDGADYTREWLLSELSDPVAFAREWLDDEVALNII